ncbi:KPN_02809 family neutral zinc metallopeptidase [Corynebacterium marinum]|uniref:Metallopeptidase, zinc binding n=2 Tax=Corynebacterium marinum TaxID=349751 RepID=A0A0B6TTR3_9CORY|nr:neutral zinc metallopeptidase [Corynebacterium marinum]AJK68975.1 metallopeptidase, zinc binding [Corynebacterium marinum DSM 44953]
MTFRGDADISGRRKATTGGRGGRIAAGGGLGSLLLVGLFLLMGGNPGDIGQVLGGGGGGQGQLPGGQTSTLEHCQTPEDGNIHADCRVDYAAGSVDQMWETILPEQAGIDYVAPGRIVFEDATQSGCGAATAATGPFYCPADQSAYFDVSFFDQLDRLGGSDAPLAQMYIVAHEFGHHVQQLEGTLSLSNYNDPGEDSNAVKIELQADCYAGIWVSHADKGEDAWLEPVTREQVTSAIDTARAVGDDNIQQRSGGEVRPDLWTHGSSEQRQNAFITGYNEGTMAACDTLERGVYRS